MESLGKSEVTATASNSASLFEPAAVLHKQQEQHQGPHLHCALPAASPVPKRQAGETKINEDRTIMPITCKQFNESAHSDPQAPLVVNYTAITTVKMVGRLTRLQEEDMKVRFTLDDGTGHVECIYWLFENDRPLQQLKEGQYTVVHGKPVYNTDGFSIQIFSLRGVTDYNDVTLHFLSVIHVHLQLKKDMEASVLALPGTAPIKGDDEAKDETNIMTILQNEAPMWGLAGISVHYLSKKLGREVSSIRHELEGLASIGEVYSTVDDDHYKAT